MLLAASLVLATSTVLASNVKQVSFSDVVSLPVSNTPTRIRYGDEPSQFVEWWRPDHNPGAPVVVFIHGGCWLSEYDISHAAAFSSALVDRGYAVWSIEYRRVGEANGGWPHSLDDVNLAIHTLMSYSDQLDTDRVALLGHSAGGHLALLAGSHTQPALRFDAVLGLAPIANLSAYAQGGNSCQRATPLFMGGTPEQMPDAYAAADPSQQRLNTNTMTMIAAEDQIVAARFASISGMNLEVINGAGHFDFLHPHTDAFAAITNYLEELWREQ